MWGPIGPEPAQGEGGVGGAGAHVLADGFEVTDVGRGQGVSGEILPNLTIPSEQGECCSLRARTGRCHGLEAQRRCEVIG